MLIDWFTVGAQALNFLVLVWLMQRFLYRPVLAAIDARERKVAAVLADADAKQADARREREELGVKTAAFDQQRDALWAKAGEAAEAERQRLLAEAAHAAEAVATRRRDAWRDEAAALEQAVGRRAQDEVFAIVRRALADLADATLESRVCAVFIGRLRALDSLARDALAAAIRAAPGPVQVRSAFVLAETERAALQLAVNETFSADVRLSFDTAPQLVAGIELTVGGQRLDWSIAGQIAALSAQAADAGKPPRVVPAQADGSAGATAASAAGTAAVSAAIPGAASTAAPREPAEAVVA